MKRSVLHSEKGVTIVEFTVTLLIFLVLAFGIIEFGSMIHERNVITHIAREGASLASRNLTSDSNLLNLMVASSNPLDFAGNSDRYKIFLADVTGAMVDGDKPDCSVQERGTLNDPHVTSPADHPNCDLTSDLWNYLQFMDPPGAPQVQAFTVVKVYYVHLPLTPVANLLNMPFFGGDGSSDSTVLMTSTAIF